MAIKEILDYDDPIVMIYRWAQELLGYHFSILHRLTEPDQHIEVATQGSTTNVLIETMIENLELISVCLEKSEFRTANGG